MAYANKWSNFTFNKLVPAWLSADVLNHRFSSLNWSHLKQRLSTKLTTFDTTFQDNLCLTSNRLLWTMFLLLCRIYRLFWSRCGENKEPYVSESVAHASCRSQLTVDWVQDPHNSFTQFFKYWNLSSTLIVLHNKIYS